MDAETSGAGAPALETLAAELTARGLDPVVSTSGGQPALVVSNPDAPALSETVLVDGNWYWWSWAERICSTADVPGAAAAISRVLAQGSDPA
jgi:hypothetical protein